MNLKKSKTESPYQENIFVYKWYIAIGDFLKFIVLLKNLTLSQETVRTSIKFMYVLRVSEQ